MEKINNNNELEIMRSQMASFKKQLEQQEIINSRIMAESMKKKFSWIKRMIIGEIILTPILLYLAFAAKYYFDLSWWSVGTFIILLLCDVWCDYDINMRAIKDSDYSHEHMVINRNRLSSHCHKCRYWHVVCVLWWWHRSLHWCSCCMVDIPKDAKDQ